MNYFDMGSNCTVACRRMTDESAELAFLTAGTSDLQS